MISLRKQFLELAGKYTDDAHPCAKLWREIESRYSENGRHYHTLRHLEHMSGELFQVKDDIHNWNTVLLALCYHDVIYDPRSKQNEADSADLAATRLNEIAVPHAVIQKIVQMILATKNHELSGDHDTDYFVDADLSILGQSRENYRRYSVEVRQEYAMYPDAIYNSGRKAVIQFFLNMPCIFKTPCFHERYARQARENLTWERAILSYHDRHRADG